MNSDSIRHIGSNVVLRDVDKVFCILYWSGCLSIDMSTFLCNDKNVIERDEDFVFYNSCGRSKEYDANIYRNLTAWRHRTFPMSSDGAVWIPDEMYDPDCESEYVIIDFNKLNADINTIVLVASIYEAIGGHKDFTFEKLDNDLRLEIRDFSTREKLADVSFPKNHNKASAMELAVLSKDENHHWVISPLGIGHEEGLESVIKKYVSDYDEQQ